MVKIDSRSMPNGVAVSVLIHGDGKSVIQEIVHTPAALLTNYEDSLRKFGLPECQIQAAIKVSAKEMIECMCRSFKFISEIIGGDPDGQQTDT